MTTAPTATLLRTLTLTQETETTRKAIQLASVLLVTALTAAAAQISVTLPFTQVPFTFQPMVVLLGGLVLGAKLGFASQVLYLAAGAAGLPVFAVSTSLFPGALRLIGLTGGYLLAYPFAAFAVGYLAQRGFDRRYLTSVLAMLVGLAIIYTLGTLWLAYVALPIVGSRAMGLSAALAGGVYPFLLPDLVKIAAAAGILPAAWRLIGRSSQN